MKRCVAVFVVIAVALLVGILNVYADRGIPGGNRPAVTVVIQPFADMPESLTDHVAAELKKVYPHVEVNEPIQLPAAAWYKPRSRYRADTLIKFLDERTEDSRGTIGLTTRDISSTKGDIKDWGVMGLSYCPGKSCVASSYRLSRSDKAGQLFKVAIHELGHTQGLQNCPEQTCFMRDADGKNTTSEERGFCRKCCAALVQKGWKMDG